MHVQMIASAARMGLSVSDLRHMTMQTYVDVCDEYAGVEFDGEVFQATSDDLRKLYG